MCMIIIIITLARFVMLMLYVLLNKNYNNFAQFKLECGHHLTGHHIAGASWLHIKQLLSDMGTEGLWVRIERGLQTAVRRTQVVKWPSVCKTAPCLKI